MRYAHGIKTHKSTIETLTSETLDFLTEILSAPGAADEIRRRGLALARAAIEKGIVK
jgi:hypothetical protein